MAYIVLRSVGKRVDVNIVWVSVGSVGLELFVKRWGRKRLDKYKLDYKVSFNVG